MKQNQNNESELTFELLELQSNRFIEQCNQILEKLSEVGTMSQENKKNSRNPLNGRYTSHSRKNQRLYLSIKIRGFETISEFAQKCNFSREFISAILYYRIRPTLNQAQKISNVLGVPILDIFEPNELRNFNLFENQTPPYSNENQEDLINGTE